MKKSEEATQCTKLDNTNTVNKTHTHTRKHTRMLVRTHAHTHTQNIYVVKSNYTSLHKKLNTQVIYSVR